MFPLVVYATVFLNYGLDPRRSTSNTRPKNSTITTSTNRNLFCKKAHCKIARKPALTSGITIIPYIRFELQGYVEIHFKSAVKLKNDFRMDENLARKHQIDHDYALEPGAKVKNYQMK